MSFFGDLAFIIGTIGTVIYMCLIVIRYTTRSGKVKAVINRYEDRIVRLEQKIGELKAKREEVNPDVNRLVGRMIELRNARDILQMRFEEMVAKSREREIHIKHNVH